jgi:hypothetical protein
MCLIDCCIAMQAEAAKMELERVRPALPCKQCRPDDPCWFHKTLKERTDATAQNNAR